MINIVKKNLRLFLIPLLLILSPPTLKAQGPGFDDDVEDTPFDSGSAILAVYAAGYGIKKLTEKKRH